MVGDPGQAESCISRHGLRARTPLSRGRAGHGISLWVTAPGSAINGDQTTATIHSSHGAKGAGGLGVVIKQRASTEKENGIDCAVTTVVDSPLTR